MEIINYSLEEWKRYLKKAKADTSNISLSFFVDYNLFEDIENPDLDDAFIVDITHGSGTIKASNKRSCLLAVYDCLSKLGFYFFNPEEEYIPELNIENINLNYSFVPSNKYRGVAPCAPKEIKTFKKYIEWLPKVGFNTIFFEGWSNYLAYKSWYRHEENPFLEKEKFTLRDAIKYDKECISLVKELGLNIHAMGHGWNVALVSDNIYNDMYPLDNQIINYEYIAEVNGKKEIPNNIIRCTNLCLSNKNMIEKLANMVVDYAINNPNIDVIHLWLADGINHTCECEKCAQTTFSDQYIEILNIVDKKMTDNNLNTKICFLVYNDTLFPPKKEIINNPERFILLFCPISRDYSRSFLGLEEGGKYKYERNHISFPVKEENFLFYLNRWKEYFNGEMIVFDYHLYYGTRYDLSNIDISDIIIKDNKYYKEAGFKGVIECGFYRCFFPSPIAYHSVAKSLFDDSYNAKDNNLLLERYYEKNNNQIAEYLNDVCSIIPIKLYEYYGDNDELRNQLPKPHLDKDGIKELIKKTKRLNKTILLENVARNMMFHFYLDSIEIISNILLLKEDKTSQNKILFYLDNAKKTFLIEEKMLLPYVSIDHLFQTMYWLIENYKL